MHKYLSYPWLKKKKNQICAYLAKIMHFFPTDRFENFDALEMSSGAAQAPRFYHSSIFAVRRSRTCFAVFKRYSYHWLKTFS